MVFPANRSIATNKIIAANRIIAAKYQNNSITNKA
jgi:hypothetical protein